MKPLLATIAVLLLASACSKSEGSAQTPASSASSTAAAMVAPVDAAPPAPANLTFEGTFTASPGTLTLPKDAPSWQGEDASAGLGPGTLTFTIDGKTGEIQGKGDGAFGPVLVRGQRGEDHEITFSIVRATPTDDGFTGTGVGTTSADGSKIEGTLRAGTSHGDVFRAATFTLAKK